MFKLYALDQRLTKKQQQSLMPTVNQFIIILAKGKEKKNIFFYLSGKFLYFFLRVIDVPLEYSSSKTVK